MKGTARFKLVSILLVLSYVLSACSGAAVQTDTSTGGGKPQSMEVSFTGTVEVIGSGTMTVSGQTVSIDAKTILDPNIQVGDIVKVEAQVSESGAVLGLKVESFSADDAANVNANTNDGNTNGDNSNANTNDDNSNANTNGDNTNGNGNTNANDNGNTTGLAEQEIFGTVEALSADSITVNGVVYQFASFTELKNAIFVGDEVKLHVIVNADGSFSVREIERSAGRTGGDDNSNGNSNGDDDDDDDNSNGNANGNSNDDDDHDDDNSNGNGNGS